MSYKYKRKTTETWKRDASMVLNVSLFLIICVMVANNAITAWNDKRNQAWSDSILNPEVTISNRYIEYIDKPIIVEQENIDTWIGKYSDYYANTKKPASYLRYQLHCLANKESGHRYNDHKKCGDNGKSCGLYQYRQPTWEMFRKEMIKKGLVSEIGSLWNNEQATETTAYALSQGYDNHWGPIVNKGACL